MLDGPRILSNLISSQHAAHAGFGGVVPEVAARHHLELTAPLVEAALAEAGVGLDRHRCGRGDRRPRPDRRPAGRDQHRQGDRRGAAAAADPGRPPAGPRRRQLPRAGAAGAALPLPRRQRRPHAAGRGPRAPGLRAARPDPRRRRRRGLRQVGAAARARLPGRAGARKGGGRGRPGGLRDAGRDGPRPRPRLQLQRPQDGARLPLPRTRRRGGRRPPGRPRRLLPGGGGRPADGETEARPEARRVGARSRSAAASPPTGRCARPSPRSASSRGSA